MHKERELLDRADRFRLKAEDLEIQLHKSIGEERKDNVEMKLKLEQTENELKIKDEIYTKQLFDLK